MGVPVVCVLGTLLAVLLAKPVRAGGGRLLFDCNIALVTPPAHTLQVVSHVATHVSPDTTRRPAAADTTRRPALVPDTAAVSDDEDKPTRKTTLLTVLAIALLTISTLLLYNVRSR